MREHIRLETGKVLHWHTLHRALWNWLAKTGDCSKVDWPGWEGNGGNVPGGINADCFACECAGTREGFLNCAACPLKWPMNHYEEQQCIGGGLYDDWDDCGNVEDRMRVAGLIRDLPVKGN